MKKNVLKSLVSIYMKYEVRELLYRKGFSRGKQADNYDELHDIAHRCCRLGKSIEDCAKEIILTIK